MAPDGRRSKAFRTEVSRQRFEQSDHQLTTLFPDVPRERMLVGLEFEGHHGFTFAHDLARRGYPVVNVLPPVTKKTKEIEGNNSPLQTDAKEAALITKLTDDDSFVRFPFLDEQYVTLRLLATERHRLSCEATRYKIRLQGMLDLAWPEYLRHFADLTHPTPRALLERWPLPEDLRAAAPRAVRLLAKRVSQNHYGPVKVAALLASAEASVALTQAPEVRRMEIRALLARWALVREQMAAVEVALAASVETCAPARALLTLPEVSAVCAATIVAELGTPEDYEHPRQVLKLAGMNLVEKSGGLYRGCTRQSKRGRPELRRQLYLLAARWVHRGRGLYRPYYEALLARNGGLKTKAVCAVARKLVPLVLAVAQSEEPFDQERWLRNRHSQGPKAGDLTA